MHLVSSLLFGFSASIDAFIVGVSFGIKKTYIPILQNIFISLITLTGTVLSICLGFKIVPLLPGRSAQASGSLILIFLGLYYSVKYLRCRMSGKPEPSEDKTVLGPDKSKIGNDEVSLKTNAVAAAEVSCSEAIGQQLSPLALKEAALLGLALSMNNMGMGIGASITGMHLLPMAAATFLFSIIFLYLGTCVGRTHIFRMSAPAADLLSGLLLIGLGLYEWFI